MHVALVDAKLGLPEISEKKFSVQTNAIWVIFNVVVVHVVIP